MKKVSNVAVPTEDKEQSALIKWADLHWFGKYLFAVPNGGIRPGKIVTNKLGKKIRICPEGIRMERQGVRAGVPDLFLAIPVPRFRIASTECDVSAVNLINCKAGLFIEMKRLKGSTTSPNQKEYHELLQSVGYDVRVCKGWVEAAKAIKEYLGLSLDEYVKPTTVLLKPHMIKDAKKLLNVKKIIPRF